MHTNLAILISNMLHDNVQDHATKYEDNISNPKLQLEQ